MTTKNDLKNLATKNDLKNLVETVKLNKEELKAEISFVRKDISDLNVEFSNTVSQTEFNKLKTKVDKYVQG